MPTQTASPPAQHNPLTQIHASDMTDSRLKHSRRRLLLTLGVECTRTRALDKGPRIAQACDKGSADHQITVKGTLEQPVVQQKHPCKLPLSSGQTAHDYLIVRVYLDPGVLPVLGYTLQKTWDRTSKTGRISTDLVWPSLRERNLWPREKSQPQQTSAARIQRTLLG